LENFMVTQSFITFSRKETFNLYTRQEIVHQTIKEPPLILEKYFNIGYPSFT
jgi:hypothetical protein